MLESKDQVLNDMRQSHYFMQEMSMARKSIKINNVEINLEELDLKKL
jgi:hypothetical protein